MMNRALLASMLMSYDESLMKLGVLLSDYDVALIQDIMRDRDINSREEKYVSFAAGMSTLGFIKSDKDIHIHMTIPETKRIRGDFNSWG